MKALASLRATRRRCSSVACCNWCDSGDLRLQSPRLRTEVFSGGGGGGLRVAVGASIFCEKKKDWQLGRSTCSRSVGKVLLKPVLLGRFGWGDSGERRETAMALCVELGSGAAGPFRCFLLPLVVYRAFVSFSVVAVFVVSWVMDFTSSLLFYTMFVSCQ